MTETDHHCVFCGALESECDRRIGGKDYCCPQCNEYGRGAGHAGPITMEEFPEMFAKYEPNIPPPSYRLDLTADELEALRSLVAPMARLLEICGDSWKIQTLLDKVNGAKQI